MPDFPLVSIAAINYNNSKFLVDTLESIRNQTYPNIELIIVDDCSTDNDVEIINNWLKTYKGKYKFIQHEKNMGVCTTYNSGLKNATGKYFAAIDTDDIMLPEKTAKQVEILEGSEAKIGAVYSDAYLIDGEGAPIAGLFIGKHRQFEQIPNGNIYEALLQGNYIPCMTFLFKRSIFDELGGYDENLVYEDYDMWLRIAQKYEVVFSDFISCTYRIRPGSLTFTIKNWEHSDAIIFSKHIGGPLPMERVSGIAGKLYEEDNQAAFPYIKKLAIGTGDRCLLAAYLAWNFQIPFQYGAQVLANIRRSVELGVPEKVEKIKDTDVRVFISEIADLLPRNLQKTIAADAYFKNNTAAMPLIKELAFKKYDRYLVAVYLLWKFSVSRNVGAEILAKIDDAINSGLRTNLNPVTAGDMPLFLDYIVPAIPLDLLMNLACDAYTAGNSQLMEVVRELDKRTKYRYYKAAYLLWKYKVNVPNGLIILNRIGGYCSVNVSNKYIDVCIYKDIFGAIRTSNSSYFKSKKG